MGRSFDGGVGGMLGGVWGRSRMGGEWGKGGGGGGGGGFGC